MQTPQKPLCARVWLKTNAALDFLRIDPDIDGRSLGLILGCNKDTALKDKKEASEKIAFEKKEASKLSRVDRQTNEKELFNNEGKWKQQ